MISFRNDYSEGAHPAILAALQATNLESTPGYGRDHYCEAAAEAVRARFACPQADVHFMLGGTLTNLTLIAAALRPWEAVIAADTAHICVHESASIEAAGHKICAAPPTDDGKLTPEHIRQIVEAHKGGDDGHMVVPRMVYLSDATELGTIYTRAELAAISETCRELGLYLYLDGARMGAAVNKVLLPLCGKPVLRRTPLGRSICDVSLAVNRHYGRADYLPCIAWGQTAVQIAGMDVGERLALEGRVQSRTYTKLLESGSEERTAFEVSIMQLLDEEETEETALL